MDLTVRDLITVVILGVIMMVIQIIVGTATGFNMFIGMALSTALICCFQAPVGVLLALRVAKRGTFLIYFAMAGAVHVLLGYWFMLPLYLILGLIIDLVVMRRNEDYRDIRKVVISWMVYAAWSVFMSWFTMRFMLDTYKRVATGGGFSQSYIDAYVSYFSDPLWLAFIFVTALTGAALGCMLGRALLRKHFERAGAV